MVERSWQFKEGDEIVPGRHAVQLLGGGKRSEAYLARDERPRPHLVLEAHEGRDSPRSSGASDRCLPNSSCRSAWGCARHSPSCTTRATCIWTSSLATRSWGLGMAHSST